MVSEDLRKDVVPHAHHVMALYNRSLLFFLFLFFNFKFVRRCTYTPSRYLLAVTKHAYRAYVTGDGVTGDGEMEYSN